MSDTLTRTETNKANEEINRVTSTKYFPVLGDIMRIIEGTLAALGLTACDTRHQMRGVNEQSAFVSDLKRDDGTVIGNVSLVVLAYEMETGNWEVYGYVA